MSVKCSMHRRLNCDPCFRVHVRGVSPDAAVYHRLLVVLDVAVEVVCVIGVEKRSLKISITARQVWMIVDRAVSRLSLSNSFEMCGRFSLGLSVSMLYNSSKAGSMTLPAFSSTARSVRFLATISKSTNG